MPADGDGPTVTVGNSARKVLIQTPERVIYSVKRMMGRSLDEVKSELKLFPFHLVDDAEAGEVPRIQLGELRFTAPEISAYVLRQLKRNAERFFGLPVTHAGSSPFPHTSMKPSVWRPETQAAWPALKSFAWSMSQQPLLSPTVSIALNKAPSPSTI